MSTKTQIPMLARVGKPARYGAMSAALLLAAGSATLLTTPARADPAGGTYGDAPAPDAEFLSDQRAWTDLDGETQNAAPRRQARARQEWRARPGGYPGM